MSSLGGNTSNLMGGQTGTAHTTTTGTTGEKADWLDKGIQSVGKKLGMNVDQRNADRIGDFANKQYAGESGKGLPGVH